jgi:hypothetical protein
MVDCQFPATFMLTSKCGSWQITIAKDSSARRSPSQATNVLHSTQIAAFPDCRVSLRPQTDDQAAQPVNQHLVLTLRPSTCLH